MTRRSALRNYSSGIVIHVSSIERRGAPIRRHQVIDRELAHWLSSLIRPA